MEEGFDSLFFGDGADLSCSPSALFTLFLRYLFERQRFVWLPVDGGSGDIFKDRFVFSKEVGYLVSLCENKVGEVWVGGEVECQFEACAIGEVLAGNVGEVF